MPLYNFVNSFGFDFYASLYCFWLQEYIKTGGKCGVCGDGYNGPREHEAGGKYAKGIIVEQLPAGSTEMKTTIQITSYHKGYFEFRICPHNDIRRPVAQECLDEYLMVIKEGTPESSYTRYYPDNPMVTGMDKYHLTLLIPRGIQCEQCVLQWTYNTGNSLGMVVFIICISIFIIFNYFYSFSSIFDDLLI